MSTIGERLKELRTKNGLSQVELAEKLGISRVQISRIEADQSSNMTISTLLSYMKVFSESADYIVTGNVAKSSFSNEELDLILAFRSLSDSDKNKIFNFLSIATLSGERQIAPISTALKDESGIYATHSSVPVLGRVAAGLPIEAIENILTFVDTSMPNIQFALYAKGDSMEPTIHDGDVIFVHRTPGLENGEIGIFKIDDEVTCKIYHQYPDRIELHSINPEYSPLIYLKDNLNSFQILGKVVLTDSQKRNFVR